jgi:hypothetical protein
MSLLATLLSYVLRTGRPKRWWLALLPTLIGVALGLLAAQGNRGAEDDFVTVVGLPVFSIVVPLTCLIVADTALGSEIRSGSFALTWLSPAPIWAITVTRWLGALLIVLGYLVPAVALAAIVSGTSQALLPAVGAVLLGSAAYLALFLLIGAVFRRAIAISLAYVIVLEHALGGALVSLASITPAWLSIGLLAGWTDVVERAGDLPQGAGAVTRLVVITLLGLGLTSWRIRRLRAATGD